MDDDRRAVYFAGTALEAISAAAYAVGGGPEIDRRAVEVARETYSELDGIATYPQIQFIDPRNPPPPGEFESEEVRRIERDRRVVAEASDAEGAATQLRERASKDRIYLEAVVSQRLQDYVARIRSER